MANVRPYLLPRRSQLDQLGDARRQALAAWASDWAPLPAYQISVQPACALAGLSADWRSYRLSKGDIAGLQLPANLPRLLEQWLFRLEGHDAGSEPQRSAPLAVPVVQQAQSALISALLGEVAEPSEDAGALTLLCRPGSGASLLTLTVANQPLRVLLPACQLAAARQVSPTLLPPLAPLRSALARQPVNLTVELGSTALTLGALQTLALGDVLTLPLPLGQALQVLAPGHVPLCQAQLGAAQGHYAVELFKGSTP
ncbi:FliM/FliN family flagellar motor switch protein [Chitinimonas sp.]|uniref:FliM/FliN family flagellar motor switch protein n=1 Tax=Chitinimonas sp. TaxID=1934313 RepID=UPI0035AF1A92